MSKDPRPPGETPRNAFARAVTGFIIYLVALPLVLLATSGTWRWWQAWAWVGLTLVMGLGSRLLLFRRDPDLAAERANFRQHDNVQPGDLVLVAIMALYGPLVILALAGLDRRFGWTERLLAWPTWASLAALVVAAVSVVFGTRAMLENHFFSAVVRIQDERNHQVCKTGPYRFVRHPGYLSAIVSTLAIPFALGSLVALLPSLVVVAATLVRTAREDRYLREKLSGYEAYTQETRARLFPGLW